MTAGRTSRFPAWMPRPAPTLDASCPGRFALIPRHMRLETRFLAAGSDRELEAAVCESLGTDRVTFDRRSGLVTQEGRLLMKVLRVGNAEPDAPVAHASAGEHA